MKKLIFSLLAIGTLISCGGKNNESSSTLNFNVGGEGKTLDPQLATSETTLQIQDLLSDGLSKVSSDLKVVPALAKSWDISDDGLVWTFHLRDNLKWSNGTPLTTADFKFAWLRALKPETAAEYAYMLFPIKNAEKFNSGEVSADEVGIEIVDDVTLKVTLEAPTAFFDSLVGFATYLPLNEEFFNEHKDDYALEPSSFISSGEYVIKDWVHNSDMLLVKNPNYYDADNVKIDNIKLTFIDESNSIYNAFNNGELDIARLTAEQYENHKDDKRVNKVKIATTWYLNVNHTNPILANENIRKAINAAIDKKDIVESVSHNTASVANSFVPANTGIIGVEKDFIEEIGNTFEGYNPEKAREYLKKGLEELNLDKLPELNLIVNDAGSNKRLAEVIQNNLKENLGVDLNIELLAFKERLSRAKSGNFDIIMSGWGADFLDPINFLDLFKTGNGNNSGKFSDSKFDELLTKASTESDRKTRMKYLGEAEKILGQKVATIPLNVPQRLYILSDRVKGVSFSGFGANILLNDAELVK